MSPIDSLPPKERAAHYREQAKEALRKATEAAEIATREGYLRVAANWHSLATDIEKAIVPPLADGAES